MAELRIKLKYGDFEFEIEGDKQSVLHEFATVKEVGLTHLMKTVQTKTAGSDRKNKAEENENDESHNPKKVKRPGTKKSTTKKNAAKLPKQLMDLNLRPKGKASLRDFYSSYDIKSNFERNALYVYYLTKELNLKNITMDHIYTAYKETGQKVPGNIYQSLIDTKKHKAWINTTDIDSIMLSVQGENFIEHDALKSHPQKSKVGGN